MSSALSGLTMERSTMESSELLCSDAYHESSAAVVTLQHLEEDKEYYEQRYLQLMREKEDSERKLERERRDRESLENNYRQELDERLRCEDKFTDVSGAMAKYERELSLLRSENSHLKTQFSQLRSVVSGRVGSASAALHAGADFTSGSFANHVVTGFVSNDSGGSLPTVSHEMYRDEVAILSHENELFKQIIEIIERQDQGQVEESFSLKGREIQGLESNDQIMWLKTENSKLEERVREIERNAREQEISIEREREKAEEDIRKLKKEVQSLKSQLEMGTQDLGDYESQITEIRRQWDEELQDMQVKLETEVSMKCQLQEQLQLLEMNIRALEEERQALLSKIETAYKKEDEVISQRGVLEDTYSQEISEMERKLDQESHEKMEAFAEVEKLTNELLEVRTQQGQMEEVYVRELEKITLRFEAEKEDFIRHVQENTNAAQAQADSGLGGNFVGSQHVLSEAQLHAGVDNWHVKLEQETRKRQNLEEENKQLLYQMNKILSGNDGVFDTGEGGKSEFGFVKNTATTSRERNEKVRELEDELTELHEKCRVLERDARKKKEFENKSKELMEEIEDLMSKKEEMARKQKELMRAAESSTSNVQDVEDKNRRLEEQIDNLSRKVRDVEDSCRREKEGVHQVGSVAKSSEVNELRWENENLKRTTIELQRNNETLESKARDVGQQLRELQGVKERMEHEAVSTVNRYSREIDLERSKAESLRQELEKTSEGLKKQANEFERTLEDRKRLYEEHQRKLEDDKQRVKNELENEKESLRRRFEDERRAIEQRVSEIEAKLQQQGLNPQDALFASGTSGAMVQQGMVSQQLGFQPKQAAANLRQEVTALKTANEELDNKVRDMERKFQREMEDLVHKHDQEKRKLSDEMRDNFRTRLEDVKPQYEMQTAESSRGAETGYLNTNQTSIADSARIDGSSGGARYTAPSGHHGGQHNQQQSNFALKFQREKEVRVFEGEKRSLNVVIQSLKKDVCALKKEKDRALLALNTARRNAENRDATNYENFTRVKSEYDERIRSEKEKTQKSTTELKRKIAVSEAKVKEIEEKYRDEMETLERKYKEQRIELESVIHNTEEQVRVRLQVEYEARLKDERERYEETLKGLRREISALQEQRKQIQLKLKTTNTLTSNKSASGERFYNKSVYSKLEYEYTTRLSEEKRKLDDRVKDLEQEVQLLKREKAEIKSSYRQEKAQMEAEFEKEKNRVEERYKKERGELRRRLDTSQVRVMLVNDDKETLAQRKIMQQSNLVLEVQRSEMESEMTSMKNRLEDLESRQRQRAASQQRKRESGQHHRVRFSSPERESAFRRTLYADDSVIGRPSVKRHSSSVDLRNDGHSSGSYTGSTSLRPGLAGSSGSSVFRRHSLSVNLPLSGEMSSASMNTGGSSLAGVSGDANFRPSSNIGMSGTSIRRHASSFELSSAGQSAESLFNRASSPTKMSSASSPMFPGRSSQFGSFARGTNFQAGGTHSMGYRPASSGMSFQGNFSRGFNALALSGGMFPRNPALFQEVNYLPSVGILGGRPVGYGAAGGYSNRVSRFGLNRAFSGSTGMLSGVGLHNGGAVRYPPAVSNAKMAAVSVSVGETASAENAGSVLISSGQQISSTNSDVSGQYQAFVSLNAEQQQQVTAEASNVQVSTDPVCSMSVSPDQPRAGAGQEEISAADMTSGFCDVVTCDGDVNIPTDDQTG